MNYKQRDDELIRKQKEARQKAYKVQDNKALGYSEKSLKELESGTYRKVPELKATSNQKPSTRYQNQATQPKKSTRDTRYDNDFDNFYNYRFGDFSGQVDYDPTTDTDIESWRNVKKNIMNKYKWSDKEFEDKFNAYSNERDKKTVEQNIELSKNLAKEHPLLGTIESFATNPGVWVEGAANMISSLPFLSSKRAQSADDTQFAISRQKEATRQAVKDEHIKSDAGKTLYDIGTSVGDMALSTGVPILGTSTLGTETASRNQRQALERGVDADKAARFGTITGLISGALNKFGIEKLASGTTAKTTLGAILEGAGIEGAENWTEEAANLLIDTLMNTDKSQLSAVHDYYTSQGMSDNDAWKRTISDTVRDLGVSFGSGAVFGGALRGVGQIPGLVSKIGNNINSRNAVQSDIQNIVNRVPEVDAEIQKAQTQVETAKQNIEKLAEQIPETPKVEPANTSQSFDYADELASRFNRTYKDFDTYDFMDEGGLDDGSMLQMADDIRNGRDLTHYIDALDELVDEAPDAEVETEMRALIDELSAINGASAPIQRSHKDLMPENGNLPNSTKIPEYTMGEDVYFRGSDDDIVRAETQDKAIVDTFRNIINDPEFNALSFKNGNKEVFVSPATNGNGLRMSYTIDGIPTGHHDYSFDQIDELSRVLRNEAGNGGEDIKIQRKSDLKEPKNEVPTVQPTNNILSDVQNYVDSGDKYFNFTDDLGIRHVIRRDEKFYKQIEPRYRVKYFDNVEELSNYVKSTQGDNTNTTHNIPKAAPTKAVEKKRPRTYEEVVAEEEALRKKYPNLNEYSKEPVTVTKTDIPQDLLDHIIGDNYDIQLESMKIGPELAKRGYDIGENNFNNNIMRDAFDVMQDAVAHHLAKDNIPASVMAEAYDIVAQRGGKLSEAVSLAAEMAGTELSDLRFKDAPIGAGDRALTPEEVQKLQDVADGKYDIPETGNKTVAEKVEGNPTLTIKPLEGEAKAKAEADLKANNKEIRAINTRIKALEAQLELTPKKNTASRNELSTRIEAEKAHKTELQTANKDLKRNIKGATFKVKDVMKEQNPDLYNDIFGAYVNGKKQFGYMDRIGYTVKFAGDTDEAKQLGKEIKKAIEKLVETGDATSTIFSPEHIANVKRLGELAMEADVEYKGAHYSDGPDLWESFWNDGERPGLAMNIVDYYNSTFAPKETPVNNVAEQIETPTEYPGEYPAIDSDGKGISNDVAKQFADSKVRDDNNNLMVMYHGTNADFTGFDTSKSKDKSSVFFTNSPDVAQSYTGTNKIHKAYLNVKNPLVIDANGRSGANIEWTPEESGRMGELLSAINEFERKESNGERVTSEEIKAYDKAQAEYDELENKINSYGDISNTDGIAAYAKDHGYDGVIIKNVLDVGSETDKAIPSTVAIVSDPNNIKEIETNTQTEVPKNEVPTVAPTEPTVPVNNVVPDVKPTEPTPPVPPSNNEVPEVKGKVRSFSERGSLDDTLPEEVRNVLAEDYYKVVRNADVVERADSLFDGNDLVKTRSNLDRAVESRDPASALLSYKLAHAYIDAGNYDAATDVIEQVSESLTRSGQFTQAAKLAMMKNDPMAALNSYMREIDKLNEWGEKKYGRKWDKVELSEEDIDAFNNIEMGDAEALDSLVSQLNKKFGKQLPSNMWEKFVAASKVSMLLNLRTQGRNAISNLAMLPVRSISDRVSAVGQNIAHLINPDVEVTQSLTGGNNAQKKAAADLFDKMKADILGENKMKDNVKGSIIRNKQVFNDDPFATWVDAYTNGGIQRLNEKFGANGNKSTMETLANLTYWLMGDVGDTPFVKKNFVNRLASYMNAQGITNIEDVPDSAVAIATQEALKATFKDDNAFSKALQGVKNKSGKFGEIALPFVKTPANLAMRAIDYSPVGLVNTFKKARSKAEVGAVIDELAKNLTGTAMILLGYNLRKEGILSGNYSEDKDEAAFQKQQGMLENAIHVGDNYYTFDWAQPSSTPLIIGSTIFDAINNSDNENQNILDIGYQGAINVANSWINSSPLQSLSEILGGSGNVGDTPADNVANTILEYPQRFVPAQLGAIARTIDPVMRDTYSGDKSLTGTLGNIGRSTVAKIPHLSKTLPASYDTWGNERTRSDTKGEAFFAQNVNPGQLGNKNETPLDAEVLRLFNATGNNAVFPQYAARSLTLGDNSLKLTNKQHSDYQKNIGQRSYEYAETLMNSAEYANLTDDEKAGALDKLYKLSNQLAKEELFNYSTDSNTKLVETAKKDGAKGAVNYVIDSIKADALGLNTDTYQKKQAEYQGGAVKYAEDKKKADALGLTVETYNKKQAEGGAEQYVENKQKAIQYGFTQKDGSANVDAYEKAQEIVGNNDRAMTAYVNYQNKGFKKDAQKVPYLMNDNTLTNEQKGMILRGTNPDELGKAAKGMYDMAGYEGVYYYYLIKNLADADGNGNVKKAERKAFLESNNQYVTSLPDNLYYYLAENLQ